MIRSSSLLLALSFGLCLFSQAVDARGRKGQNVAARDGKVLSLFNIVTFKNEPCASTAKTGSGSARNGTCYTSSECNDKKGTRSGNCAAGFGVCCVFTVENTGDSISQNCSYIRNPGFPATYSGTETKFTHTINKCSCDVCYFRLDFEAFTMRGTADTLETAGGACLDTFAVTSSTGQTIPTICGENSGKHMYIESGQNCGDSISVSSSFTGSSSTRRWDIKVSQIECSNTLVPPQGCLEYMIAPTGRITSFNWENSGETHLASQNQKVCVRSTKNSCCVQYTLCNDPLAFKFEGTKPIATPSTDAAKVNTECSKDYIEAQNFTPDCYANGPTTPRTYRICGGHFNTLTAAVLDLEAICVCDQTYSLTFVTDNTADPAAGNDMIQNKGLCLDYSLINC